MIKTDLDKKRIAAALKSGLKLQVLAFHAELSTQDLVIKLLSFMIACFESVMRRQEFREAVFWKHLLGKHDMTSKILHL